MPREMTIRFSVRTLALAALAVAAVWLVLALRSVLVLFFVAVLLAVAVAGIVELLERWRVPRMLGIIVAYLLILLILIGFGFVLVPLVLHQIDLLRVQLPNLVREPLRQASELIAEYVPSLRETLPTGDLAQQVAQQVASFMGGVGSMALSLGRRLAGFVINILVVLVLAFFLVSRPNVADRFIGLMIPTTYRERLINVTHIIGRRLGRWLWAQLLIATFYAVAFGLGLALLGVPYAVALGFIGGLLELVPYVGGFIATILTMIVAFTVEPTLAIWVLVLHLIIGNIEVHILAPKLMGRAVETHPVITIVAMFSGIELLGLIGALIAIPLVVVVQALVEEFWIKRINPAATDQSAMVLLQPPVLAESTDDSGYRIDEAAPGIDYPQNA